MPPVSDRKGVEALRWVQRLRQAFAAKSNVLLARIESWPHYAGILVIAGVELAQFGVIVMMFTFFPILWVEVLTTVSSILVKLLGQPAQILKLRRAGSVREFSLTNALSNQVSYECWVGFAVRTHSLVVIFAQGIGIIGATALVWIVLRYTIQPSKTHFAHFRSPRCVKCREVIAEIPELADWPVPCVCGGGLFHPLWVLPYGPGVSQQYTPLDLMPRGWLEAHCDACSRIFHFDFGGPLNDPAWWADKQFWLREMLAGAEYRRVTMAEYIVAERASMATLGEGSSRLRHGVPSWFEFRGVGIRGEILMASGETLLDHMANLKGEEVGRHGQVVKF